MFSLSATSMRMVTDTSLPSSPGEISWYGRINCLEIALIPLPSVGTGHSTETHLQSHGYLRGWTSLASLRSMSTTSTLAVSSGIYSNIAINSKTSTKLSSIMFDVQHQEVGQARDHKRELRILKLLRSPTSTSRSSTTSTLPSDWHSQLLRWVDSPRSSNWAKKKNKVNEDKLFNV